MRCIEIAGTVREQIQRMTINRNMRCIEIRFVKRFEKNLKRLIET